MRGRLRMAPLLAPALAALAACAGAPSPDGPPSKLAVCEAEKVQTMIGHMASAALGQQMLKATGARQLRWAPPRSAMTMDYRTDRLTVEYDDAMKIRRVSCG